MKHTPAPWKDKGGLITNDQKAYICDVLRATTIEEHHANARLIAAAPDYFAIVEAILEDKTLSAKHIRDMLRPAHTKAKGE